jgi:hypothetical protein
MRPLEGPCQAAVGEWIVGHKVDKLRRMPKKAVSHKLTAILYADVAGYSCLTGDDELGTHHRVMSALDAGKTAVKLDENDPFAHVALGRVHTLHAEHDFVGGLIKAGMPE